MDVLNDYIDALKEQLRGENAQLDYYKECLIGRMRGFCEASRKAQDIEDKLRAAEEKLKRIDD